MEINETPIQITPTGPSRPTGSETEQAKGGKVRFGDQLKELLSSVNDKQQAATKLVDSVAAGKTESLHTAMLALEEASVSFQLMLEVRNKMLEAYQEINRMNI